MKKLSLLTLFLCATLTLTARQRISLDSHSGNIVWEVRPLDEANPLPAIEAQVPGCVFASYVAAGIEENPEFGDNVYRVDKSRYDGDFLYTGRFRTPHIDPGKRLWLHFEGVNRKAVIRLNGEMLGTLDGFMQRGCYDITKLLRPDAENVLTVEVEWVGFPVPNFRSPTYISSAGWDWMPYAPGLLSGITDDVYLTTSGEVRILDPWIRTRVPDRRHATVEIRAELENLGTTPCSGILRGTIEPGKIAFSREIRLEPRERKSIRLTHDEIKALAMEDPQLWWPNGLGDPVLHTCRLDFESDGEISDTREIRFGIRQYDYETRDGIFRIKINGEPVYVKGGNWGMSEWLLRCRGAEYDTRVALHRHMNYNMIRNWIGSVTDEEFYDACDKYGIMVWDDFWLNSHPNLPHDLQAFQENAIEKIKRLRNHACIAVWCGDNEGVPQKPLDDWLRGDVAYYDAGDRHYQSISNAQGLSGSGPWANFHPAWYFTPHPMPYGYRGEPAWGFRTEIGTAVFTTFESFRRFMPEECWWPRNEMWDKHFFGKQAANAAPDKYFETVERNYGPCNGIEEFCRKAQLLNLEVNKAMYEGWQHHLWDDATGIMTWMSQSAYPSLVWQTYDYYFDPTGAYWGVRKACEHVHIQWSPADNSVKAVNTTREALDEITATARVYDLNGRLLPQYSQRLRTRIPANGTRDLFDLDFAAGNIARNRPVTVSSVSADAGMPEAITDGNDMSRWSSEYSDDQWIRIDLEEPRRFSEIVLKWEEAHAASYIIEVSEDAATWRNVYEAHQSEGGVERIKLQPLTARYIRVVGTKRATPWGYSLYEVEVYDRSGNEPALTPVHFIRLELSDRNGKTLSDNFYWRSTDKDDYTALNTLAPAKLRVRTQLRTQGSRKTIRAEIRNVGHSVAFAIHLQPYRLSDAERILPFTADDNYFTLFQGESRVIEIEFDGSLLPDDRYELRAEAYNSPRP